MTFFKFKDYIKSWSTWVLSAVTVTPVLEANTGWVSAIIPSNWQPFAISILGAIGLVARAIKQKP